MKLKLKTVNCIFFTAVAISLCLMLISAITQIIPLFGISLLLWLGSVVFRAIFYVCPYCGHSLFRQALNHKFCPHCGEEL